MTEDDQHVRQMFEAPAAAYDQLMGRYLATLGPAFADAAGITAGTRVLDVGCGPGGLTSELVRLVGPESVAAIDPSPPFVEACRSRHPGVDVRVGVAEEIPFDDDAFDATLASLVVGFMSDPATGAREMARVTRPGGVVAMCFWDLNRMPAINTFWAAAAQVDADSNRHSGDQRRFGRNEGDLGGLLRAAGLGDVQESALMARSEYADFDDWWTPFTLGVGPIGSYVASISDDQRQAIRAACDESLGHPREPFTMQPYAWFARGTA